MNIEVYDIEILKSCFTSTHLNINTGIIKQFVIHEDRNDLKKFIDHLGQLQGLIGFNSLDFDYPIIHFILKNYENWVNNDPKIAINEIFNEAQRIIQIQDNSTFSTSSIKEKDHLIPQLDLFKVWHYNNAARKTSLKALEISMNFPNVMECDIPWNKEDIKLEEVGTILEYNLNDVLATYEFYKKTEQLGKLSLRKNISKKFNLSCRNWNNGKIGENLILKLYCDKLKLNQWEVRKLRTKRDSIKLSECIPSTIKFNTEPFNNLLNFFKSKTITNTKGAIDYSFVYKGIKYVYGTGGIHASVNSAVYESNTNYIIKSLDVASLYPNIPLVFGFTIEHLGNEFLEVYRDNIVNVRLAEKLKPKDQQDKAIVDGLKEAANIPYGKSNDENSFLYDPLYSMKTTIAGQLVISMLCERLSEIPDSQMLMVNTDGCEIRIPRQYEQIYKDICTQWEKETRLTLEFVDYSKMIIGDINNYIAVTTDNKIKNKGRFEVEKVIGGEPAYHKDNSFKVIPLAIQEYFVNNIPIEQTIKNHTNIYDFCGRQKFKGKDFGEINGVKYDDNKSPYHYKEKQQKNVRYYISTKGYTFIKRYAKGSSEIIHKDRQVTIFNKFVEKSFEDYDIDYQYYINECQKEISNIVSNQLTLF